jgi:hypothetical protein
MSEFAPGTMFQDLEFLGSADPATGDTGVHLLGIDGTEGFNPPMDDVSATFFTELDAHTEYWDVYDAVPDGRYYALVRVAAPALAAWRSLVGSTSPKDRDRAELALKDSLDDDTVADAVVTLDRLMISLAAKHFPGAERGVDPEAYLNVVEAFARDVLPPDEDRLKRVTDLGDPEDQRLQHALRHRMDGSTLWFTWAAVVDAAEMVDEGHGTDERREIHALMLAGCAAGSAFDYVFRSSPGNPRGVTRPVYRADEPTLVDLREAARAWAADMGQARDNARDLARIAGVR